MNVLHGAFGLAGLLFIAWLLSENRWRIPLRVVLAGVALQIALACLFISFRRRPAFFFSLTTASTPFRKRPTPARHSSSDISAAAPRRSSKPTPKRASFSLFAPSRSFS